MRAVWLLLHAASVPNTPRAKRSVPNVIHIDAPTEPKKAKDFTRRDVERDAVNRSGLTECGSVIHSVE